MKGKYVMKKLLLIAILMLTIVFAAVACKDNTSKPADTTVEDGTTAEPTTTVAPETTAEPETTITETTAEETTAEETTAPETTVEETTVEETTAPETTAEETTAEETEPETEAETVAVPDDATNVALGGRVTTPNYWSIYGNNFYPWYLNDGVVNSTTSWYCNQGTPAGELYATIDLGNVYTLYQIKLANPCWNAFPDAYELQVSLDGSTWTTVASATGMTAKAEESGVVVHGLTAAVEAKYVRLQILAHAPSDNPVSGIGEFEVYGIYAREPGVKVPEGATNVALGATVTAPTAEINTGTWAAENLVDGSWDTLNDTNSKLGWTSPVLEMPPDDLRVLLELEEMCTLYRITLYPMQWDQGTGFPKGYELWVSEDGEDWTMVASASGVDASAASDTAVKPIVHYLDEAVRAKYFALKITEHSSRRWDGVPHSAIGEIELTGVSDKKDMITTDKYSYGAGEAINVTAYGFGTDMVALFLKADFEAGNFNNYIYRYSVGFDGGKTVNILDAEANPSMFAYHAVPAGEYVVAIVNVGGTVIDSKKIIVDGSIDVEEPETDVEVNEGFVDVPAGATNVALQGTVTATNYWSISGNNFYPWYLNDGVVNNTTSWYCNQGTPAGELYATIDLGGVYTLYQIKLANPCWGAFPDAYELQVSLDGGTWTTVALASNMSEEGSENGAVHGLTAAVNAKYVRLQILAHAPSDNPVSGIGEFEVYGIYLGDPEVETEPEEDPYMGVNLAPFGQVTVPNHWDAGYGNVFYPWYLNDGNWPVATEPNSWYCLPNTPAGDDLYVTLELGGVSMIDRIVLGRPSWGNFPDAYKLQVSMDGNRWTTVATASNMATEGEENGVIHNLTMPVRAKYVRVQILAHKSGQTNSGLGELEVWGVCEESLNYAIQGQVTASNYWFAFNSTHFYPSYLNDGVVNGTTSWYCNEGTPAGELYVAIDLGGVYALDKIVLKNACWNFFPHTYELQVSLDGEVWTPVASATGMTSEAEQNGEVVHGLTTAVKAKYVRLQILAHSTEQNLSGLGEFEVWGKPVAN